MLAAIRERMGEVGLKLHPEKTRIVYCQDDNRRRSYEHVEFTFLGYTFCRRSARRKDGGMFLSFLPAISREALSRISAQVRSWRLHHRTDADRDLLIYILANHVARQPTYPGRVGTSRNR